MARDLRRRAGANVFGKPSAPKSSVRHILQMNQDARETPMSDDPQVQVQSFLRFRDLLEAAPDGIIEVERDGTIVLVNAAAERIFGYPREELLGQLMEILVPDAQRRRHHEHRDRYGESAVTRPMGIGLELFAQRKDGSQFPVEISLSPIRSAQGSRVIAIVRDISSRRKAEAKISEMHREFAAELEAKNQQLEIRNREVERANRLKSEFLASMSHELRTPLHTIIGFADLLAEELKGPLNSGQKRFVTHVQQDSRHLLELINDILDLSKIESGRLELHIESFNAAEAIIETVTGLRPLAASKRIEIEELLDRSLVIDADRVRFKEVFYNLVSNAIKFTPDGGHITAECQLRSDSYLFAVSDTGIGIEPSEQQAIFDKFYQVSATTRGVREGTGLGLAISKSLVEMHNGRIWVESTPGIGSRFQFIIPIAQPDGGPEQGWSQGPQRPGPVLVVGMDESFQSLSEFLEQRGYPVTGIASATSGLEVARVLKPSAVLLDMVTAGGDGWRLFQDLRASQETAHIPVLVLTRAQGVGSLDQSLGAAVLMKPITPSQVLRIVEEQVLRPTGEPARILIVDDEAEARELLEEALRSGGLLPVLASNGKQALEILARSPISAVIVDLMMPEMSGVELILRIRQNPAFAQLAVIVLTAKEMDEEDMQIVSRQANAIFLKGSPWRESFLLKLYELLQQVVRT